MPEPEFAAAVARAARGGARGPHARRRDEVTQFEALTAAAYHELARSGVEVAVVEAGLGGRYDATNVIPSAVQVLTERRPGAHALARARRSRTSPREAGRRARPRDPRDRRSWCPEARGGGRRGGRRGPTRATSRAGAVASPSRRGRFQRRTSRSRGGRPGVPRRADSTSDLVVRAAAAEVRVPGPASKSCRRPDHDRLRRTTRPGRALRPRPRHWPRPPVVHRGRRDPRRQGGSADARAPSCRSSIADLHPLAQPALAAARDAASLARSWAARRPRSSPIPRRGARAGPPLAGAAARLATGSIYLIADLVRDRPGPGLPL